MALEYALSCPDRLSHLILLNTGADSRWFRENAAKLVAERGYGTEKAELVRRWFHGEFAPRDMFRILMQLGSVYNPHMSLPAAARMMFLARRSKLAPEALIFAGRTLHQGWSVVDRLGEISAPTLVIAGRDDFVYPPGCQLELAEGIPNARLMLIEGVGHNPHEQLTDEVMEAVRDFVGARTAVHAR